MDDQREINGLLYCREHNPTDYKSTTINCSLIDDNIDEKLLWCVEGIEDTFPPTFPLNFSIVEKNMTIDNKKAQVKEDLYLHIFESVGYVLAAIDR